MKNSLSTKEKNRIKYRNKLAKHMLSDERSYYRERTVPDKSKENKFRKDLAKKGLLEDENY